MSVPKSKRNESDFETQHNLKKIRDEVTFLMMNNFGYSDYQFQKQIDAFKSKQPWGEDKTNEIVDRWIQKRKMVNEWFIEKERDAVIDILRQMQTEFSIANSIYPSPDTIAQYSEYIERRLHMDKAIGYCFTLITELQYIKDSIPADLNLYDGLIAMIEKQVNLFKGVRQSDNRFLKDKKVSRNKKKKNKDHSDNSETNNSDNKNLKEEKSAQNDKQTK